MAKFRKKPVVIEAVQWNGSNGREVTAFLANRCPRYVIPLDGHSSVDKPNIHAYGIIHTLEGDMSFTAGDWIIKGVKGEFYPCKPDIFEATYERVEDYWSPLAVV